MRHRGGRPFRRGGRGGFFPYGYGGDIYVYPYDYAYPPVVCPAGTRTVRDVATGELLCVP